MKAAITNPVEQGATPLGADVRSQLGLATSERSPAEWRVCVALFLLSSAYLFLFRQSTSSPDEGITLQGAQRILDGQVMYRDFFYFCTPGSYYFLALLFRIFGDSIAVARTWLAVEGGLMATLSYLIARRVCARWSALLTVTLIAVTALPSVFFVLHNWDSTLWACLTLYCAVWYLQQPSWGWAFALGSCCSLTVLFEQSKGGGIALGLVAGFIFLRICGQTKWRRACVVVVLAGLVWPIAATLTYFAANQALTPMVQDLLFPFRHFYTVGVVPYGYLNWGSAFSSGTFLQSAFILGLSIPYFLLSALPIFGAGIFVYSATKTWKMRDAVSGCWPYYVLVTACTTGLFLSVLASRKDVDHFVMTAPAFSLILAWFLDGHEIRFDLLKPVMPLLVLTLAFLFGLVAVSRLLVANSLVPHPTRRGVVRVPPRDTALAYLPEHTLPGEEIFVYPYNPAYYYLTGTYNPTRYDFLHPGLNSPGQVREVLDTIGRKSPRVVLFENSFYEEIVGPFPFMPMRVMAGDDPIGDFILEKYKACAALVAANSGHLVFMVRKDSACPEAAGGEKPQVHKAGGAGTASREGASPAGDGSGPH